MRKSATGAGGISDFSRARQYTMYIAIFARTKKIAKHLIGKGLKILRRTPEIRCSEPEQHPTLGISTSAGGSRGR
jgi:hypothetical protein